MNLRSSLKRAAMAAVTVGALSSIGTVAHALVFNPGDAVLVVHGNTQEGYVNLGRWDTVRTTGGTWDVSDILATPGISGTNPIRYTVVGNSGSLVPAWFGANRPVEEWTTTQRNRHLPNPYNTALINWAGQLRVANDPGRRIYATSDPLLAFHLYLDPGDNDTLAGSMPVGIRGGVNLGDLLYLIERPGGPATMWTAGTAFLNSQTGQFRVQPIPVPAALILFGSGLVGLAGMARRTMGRLTS
jgi:hypothetical protein